MSKIEQKDLGRLYKSFQLSEDDKALFIDFMRLPKNKAKMYSYASKNKINNDDVDFWMSVTPERKESESYDDYKSRMLFQKHLLKYRAQIYNFYQTQNIA